MAIRRGLSTPCFGRGLYSIPKDGAILEIASPDRALKSCMKKQEAEFARAERAYPDQSFFRHTEVDTDVVDFRQASISELKGEDKELDAEVYGVQDESDKLQLVLNSTARLLKSGECQITPAKAIMESFDHWKSASKFLSKAKAIARVE